VTRQELLHFLRRHRLAVVATASPDGRPQAAVVGIAVTDQLEIVFDTVADTRKIPNLRRNPRAAVVVGWDDEQTAQIDGIADEPRGDELARLQRAYFAAFPDGPTRLAWPGITYVRIRPTWARYSDFRPGGRIVEVPLGDA
jgi:PPOX class probable F420-dependent enzyme